MATTGGAVAETVLSVAEITDGINNLSDADLMRIKRASQYLSYGGSRVPEELRQEAVKRAVDGTRKCPRHVGIAKFICRAMESIASSDRKAASRKRMSPVTSEHNSGSASIPECHDPRLTPEDQILTQEAADEIRAALLPLFQGDLVAQALVNGMIKGMEGLELREFVGLNEKAFATKRRLVRRRIDKAFPNGWTQ